MRKNLILFLIITSFLGLMACLEFFPDEDLDGAKVPITYISSTQTNQADTFTGYHFLIKWSTAEDAEVTVYYRNSEDYDNDEEGWLEVTGELEIETRDARIREIESNEFTKFISNETYDLKFESVVGKYSGSLIMDEAFTVSNMAYQDGISGTFRYIKDHQPQGSDGDFYIGIWNKDQIEGAPYKWAGPIAYGSLDPNNESSFYIGGPYNIDFRLAIWREFESDGDNSTPIPDMAKEAIYVHPGFIQVAVPTGDHEGGTVIEDICVLSEPAEMPDKVVYTDQPREGSTFDPGDNIEVTMAVKNQWDESYSDSGIISFTPTNTDITLSDTSLDYNQNGNGDEPSHTMTVGVLDSSDGVKVTQIEAWFDGYKPDTLELSNTFYISNVNIEIYIKYTENDLYSGPIKVVVKEREDTGTYAVIKTITINDATVETIADGTKYHVTHTEEVIAVPGFRYVIEAYRDFNGDGFGFYTPETDAYGDVTIDVTNQDYIMDTPLLIVEPSMARTSIDATFTPQQTTTRSGDMVDVDIELRDQWGNLYNDGLTQSVSFISSNNDVNISHNPGANETTDGSISLVLTLTKTDSGIQSTELTAEWDTTGLPPSSPSSTIDVENNIISGSIDYTPGINHQTDGDIIIELWKASDTDTSFSFGSPAGSVSISEPLPSFPHNLVLSAPDSTNTGYYIRAYRDYSGSSPGYDQGDSDDLLMDAYMVHGGVNTPTTLTVNHGDITMGSSLALNDKVKAIYSLQVTSPASSISLQTNDMLNMDVTSYDQWGHVFGDNSEDINLQWDTLPTQISGLPASVMVDNTGITDIDVILTSAMEETNQVLVILDSKPSIQAISQFITVDGRPPQWTDGTPEITENTGTDVELRVETHEVSDIYFALYNDGSSPTKNEIKNGTGALDSGSIMGLSASTDHWFQDIGDGVIVTNNAYDLYALAVDDLGNEQTNATRLDFTASDLTPPVWEVSTPSLGTIYDDGVELTVQIDEDGKAYYVVVADGSPAPTPGQVKAHTAPGLEKHGNQVLSASSPFTFNITGLDPATDYDIYVVAEDDEVPPNLQTTVEFLQFTTDTEDEPPILDDIIAINDSSVIILIFNEQIDSSITLEEADFTVHVEGGLRNVTNAKYLDDSYDNKIELTIAVPKLASGESVQVEFDKLNGVLFEGIKDMLGNELDSFNEATIVF
jgi:hypothetical protein